MICTPHTAIVNGVNGVKSPITKYTDTQFSRKMNKTDGKL